MGSITNLAGRAAPSVFGRWRNARDLRATSSVESQPVGPTLWCKQVRLICKRSSAASSSSGKFVNLNIRDGRKVPPFGARECQLLFLGKWDSIPAVYSSASSNSTVYILVLVLGTTVLVLLLPVPRILRPSGLQFGRACLALKMPFWEIWFKATGKKYLYLKYDCTFLSKEFVNTFLENKNKNCVRLLFGKPTLLSTG